MKAIFRYRLARFRGQILGWGIGLALMGLLLVQIYGTVAAQQDQFEQLLQSYPEDMMAFFGGFDEFTSPSGYLGIEFFSYMPLILGIFGVLMGSGLLSSDEEAGRLDLIMAYPISRTALFLGRALAFVVATLAILALSWAGIAVPSTWSALDVGWLALAWPFLSLFAVIILFGALALFLSQWLPSRRMSAMATGLLLVASFFIIGFARLNTDLEPFAKLSPLYYYQGGEALEGLNLSWFLGLLAVSLLFGVLAWWRFQRRDIRVGGEGGWERSGLSWLWRRGKSKLRGNPKPEGTLA